MMVILSIGISSFLIRLFFVRVHVKTKQITQKKVAPFLRNLLDKNCKIYHLLKQLVIYYQHFFGKAFFTVWQFVKFGHSIFSKKFREINSFTNKSHCKLISRNTKVFSMRVHFWFLHTVLFFHINDFILLLLYHVLCNVQLQKKPIKPIFIMIRIDL